MTRNRHLTVCAKSVNRTLLLGLVAMGFLALLASEQAHSDVVGVDPLRLSVPQHIVDRANQAPLTGYSRTYPGGAHTNGAWNGGWQIPLALAAWGGNTSADAKLVQQINYNLRGDQSITVTGGYHNQHQLHFVGMVTILKQSDRFWNNVLNSSQREKIDLLVRAFLVASAFTTSDCGHSIGTDLTGSTNLNRNWNPNYREGMFGGLLQAMVFFGSVDAVTQILSDYSHSTFVSQLSNAGLDNPHYTFTVGGPSGSQIENCVRNYRFENRTMKENWPTPFDLLMSTRLTLATYGRDVKPGLTSRSGDNCTSYGQGWRDSSGVCGGFIVTSQGVSALPNVGVRGMLTEFDSSDANGARSSFGYSYDGFRPNLTNHVSTLVGGHWQSTNNGAEGLRRKGVGVVDLTHKLTHGYRDYKKGRGETRVNRYGMSGGWDWSFYTSLPLWSEVISPFHAGSADSPPEADPLAPVLLPITGSFHPAT